MTTAVRSVETAGGTRGLHEATPAGEPIRRAVVVVQEAFGVSEHLQDVTRRLADDHLA